MITTAERDGIDSRVESAIRFGHTNLVQIQRQTTLEERAVDRSLQRLRKAGRIRFERGGPGKGRWVIR